MTPTPIACTLTPDQLRARRDELLPGLADRATSIERGENGLCLHFLSADMTVRRIASVVDAERHCCRFLRFEIHVEPDAGAITLTVTAPPEAQSVLADLIGVTESSTNEPARPPRSGN